MEPILNSNELKIWQTMPEIKKRHIFKIVYSMLARVAKRQLDYVSQWKLVFNDEKQSAHVYVFETVENFWKNVGLAQYLGKGNYANFAHYPVRVCMEMFLQFFYFCKQPMGTRNHIAILELLRPSVRYYMRATKAGGNTIHYKEFYDRYSKELNLPQDIDNVKERDIRRSLTPFPPMKKLCENYHSNDPDGATILYFLYQYLCESVHGKTFAQFLRKQAVDFPDYRRGMMILYIFCKDILVLLDKNYLGNRFRTDVEGVVSEADNFIKNSVNRYNQNPMVYILRRKLRLCINKNK